LVRASSWEGVFVTTMEIEADEDPKNRPAIV
jgi:hypothetical protein